MPAMRPCVSTNDGKVVMPSVVPLLVLQEPAASTAFFKFQVQKTNEPEETRDAALKYLGADYFQSRELFSDEMTAVFGRFAGGRKPSQGQGNPPRFRTICSELRRLVHRARRR